MGLVCGLIRHRDGVVSRGHVSMYRGVSGWKGKGKGSRVEKCRVLEWVVEWVGNDIETVNFLIIILCLVIIRKIFT